MEANYTLEDVMTLEEMAAKSGESLQMLRRWARELNLGKPYGVQTKIYTVGDYETLRARAARGRSA